LVTDTPSTPAWRNTVFVALRSSQPHSSLLADCRRRHRPKELAVTVRKNY
jgi:hypothetical protein